MPACRINFKFQHNFHYLTLFKSKTTRPIFTIFLHDVDELMELVMRISARQW